MSLSGLLKSSLLSDRQERVTQIMRLYEDENHLYLHQHPSFQETVLDQCRYKNDLILLGESCLFYLSSKQKFVIDSVLQARKFLAKNDKSILIAMENSNELFLFDLSSKEFQHIKIQGLLKDEMPISGMIYNSTKEKLKIWVGTNKGRVISIEKVYIRNKQAEIASLEEREVEAIHLIFSQFLVIITNKEILILRENLTPYQKISKKEEAIYMTLITASKDRVALVFEKFIMHIQLADGQLTYTQVEAKPQIVSVDWIENQRLLMLLHEEEGKNILSCLSIENNKPEFIINMNFAEMVLSRSVSMIMLGSETLFLTGGKLYRCNKIATDSTNLNMGASSLKELQNNLLEKKQEINMLEKSNNLPEIITIDSLLEALNSNEIPRKNTIKMIEEIFKQNPKLLYPHNEKILRACLKAGERNNPVILHLIENSSNIHLEDFLNIMIEHKAYIEAVYLYFKMGSYEEAFDLCEKQDNLDLMFETLQRCPLDQEHFSVIFVKLMNYLKRTSRDIPEDTLIKLMERHPNLLECLEAMPVKWMKNPRVIKTLITMFEKYRFENRTLLKSKQIQIQEIWSQFNGRYSDSNTYRKVNGPEKCKLCEKGLYVIDENTKPNSLIQFFSCTHIFHRQCLEDSVPESKKDMECPLCK